MSDQPLAFFSSKLDESKNENLVISKKIRFTSVLRIFVFFATILAVYLSTYVNLISVFSTLTIGVASFIVLVNRHLKLYKQKKWQEALSKVLQEEISIIKGESNPDNSGLEYVDDEHAFTGDLDVFGKKSLFRLINRTSTLKGKNSLANILSYPLKNEEHLKQRQEAINELREKSNWRINFQAKGKINEEEKGEIEGLLNWANQEYSGFSTPFYKSMLFINPFIGLSLVVLSIIGVLSSSWLVFFLLLPLGLVGTKLGVINKHYNLMSKKTSLLEKYSGLFNMVEEEEFKALLLCEIKHEFCGKKHSANKEIKALSKIMASFDYRLNMLMGIIMNVFFLWDIRQLIRLDNWKKQNSEQLENWFEQLSLIDELNSFAGFNYAFQLETMPEFSQDFKLEATNAKHPFLLGTKNVGNPINIPSWKQFYVVTGANMAGKSTYLRTVGVNLLLAMTGSSVVADKFVFKPVDIISGIKTTDSLQDGESYFFAELKRLKQIIVRLENGEKLFVILDEILRGTNSADKQKGSLGLIKQLLRLNASGIIATHDLELGKLINSFPENINNKRFEVEITNNELVFDYKIKDGISQNLNATFLMKKMGITVE